MLLALAAGAIVALALLGDVAAPRVTARLDGHRRHRRRPVGVVDFDPGRELRAELRARALLESCVSSEDWAMYRDLGFLRVWGHAKRTIDSGPDSPPDYAYLIYPHRPIVAYVPATRSLLSEYCVEFPDLDRPYGSARLPDSDDVLAKWMGLTGDEQRLLASANMHLPGRQIDPDAVCRDLWRLAQWESSRARRPERVTSVRAS